jgi:X-X-X-Leu-X-X-Gly heptad repeat protein
MATMAAVFTIDYANTATLTNGTGTLASGVASGIIQLGKHRVYQISVKDTTTAASISQISFTAGNSAGTVAPAPTGSSPFLSVTQSLVFDTGEEYDQIQLANFHNGADSIDYSVTVLSKF